MLALAKIVPDWLGGKTLERYGKHLMDGAARQREIARGMIETAEDFERLQGELRNLTWEDAMSRATDRLNKLSEAAVNVVSGFKVAAYRFGATNAAGPVALSSPAPQQNVTATGGGVTVGDVNITTSGDGRETYREFYDELDQLTRTSGGQARAFFYSLPRPAV